MKTEPLLPAGHAALGCLVIICFLASFWLLVAAAVITLF
jgi:hypothetical protein